MKRRRAEYRLMLREDNADIRLTEVGRQMGLVDDERWQAFSSKAEAVESLKGRLQDLWVRPGTPEADALAEQTGMSFARERRATELLKVPEVNLSGLLSIISPVDASLDPQVIEQVEIQGKYAGYLDRQIADVEKTRHQQEIALPDALDYAKVTGLSNEVRQKFIDNRPETVGQASRIPGVTPAAISLLLVHLKKQSLQKSAWHDQRRAWWETGQAALRRANIEVHSGT